MQEPTAIPTAEGERQRLDSFGTIWCENKLSFVSASAERMVLNLHGLNEQLVPLHGTRLRSGISPGVAHHQPPASSRQQPYRAQRVPLPDAPAHSSCPHQVHIWGDVTIHPVTGQTPGAVLAPSSPACQSPASSSGPDPRCPVPSSPTRLGHHSSLIPCLSLPAPVCPHTAPELALLLSCSGPSHGSPVPSESKLCGLAPRPCGARSLKISPSGPPLRPLNAAHAERATLPQLPPRVRPVLRLLGFGQAMPALVPSWKTLTASLSLFRKDIASHG